MLLCRSAAQARRQGRRNGATRRVDHLHRHAVLLGKHLIQGMAREVIQLEVELRDLEVVLLGCSPSRLGWRGGFMLQAGGQGGVDVLLGILEDLDGLRKYLLEQILFTFLQQKLR